jgi:hypothetical protein
MLLCAAVIAMAGIAAAAPLPIEDGFETVPVGDYPTANGWATLFYGKGAWVSDEVACSGSNSFRLDCWPWLPAAEYLLMDEVPDRLTYQASVYVHPEHGMAGRVGFVESQGDEGLIWNCFSIDGGSGQVEFWGEGTWVLGPYVPGTWCTVRADLDYEDQSADLWLDGECVVAGAAITPREFPHPTLGDVVLDQLTLVADNDQTGLSFIFSNLVYYDDVQLRTVDNVMTVEIDIKPGEEPNPVNCSSRGLLPVAVLSSDSFDASQIDVLTVSLAGAGVAVRGYGAQYMAHLEDVNADALVDLMLHFETQDLDLEQLTGGVLVLSGSTFTGETFEASDEVVLVGNARRCRSRR